MSDLRQIIEKNAISEVLFKYARAIDRKDFAGVTSCYWPEATDNHGGYCGPVAGLIEDMKVRHRTIDSSQHFISNVLIDLFDSQAKAESYCLCILRQANKSDDGSQHSQVIRCRYVDRFEQRGDEWKIEERIVVFDEVVNVDAVDVLSSEWVRSKRDLSDPVYASRIR